MKVLVVIKRSPAQRFLVELPSNRLVKEVSSLIAKRKHSKAIVAALTKGRFEREVLENEARMVKADIILTEESAHWDLTKGNKGVPFMKNIFTRAFDYGISTFANRRNYK